jgi:hypothetical protein
MSPLPIAHRGLWWPETKHQNNSNAFWAAVKAGYGIELDIRLWGGKDLVIQHEPGDPTLLLSAEMTSLFTAPLLAWNLKIVSAAEPLVEFIRRHGMADRSVVFDHELMLEGTDCGPMDTGKYMVNIECPGIMTRASDREDEPLYLALSAIGQGVWLDAFERDWVTADTIRTVHAAGKSAYVVSPELHGRPLDLGLWKAWGEADGICTDFPHLLEALQGGGALEPVDPWWGP